METAFIGDIHGCASELTRLIAEVEERTSGPVEFVLVGDLFTKGPDPVGVWKVVKTRGLRSILGNHDQRLLDVLEGNRPRDAHARSVVAALDAEDKSWRAWLSELPLCVQEAGFIVTHAALHPSGDIDRTDRETHLYRRRWGGPDHEGSSAPMWWQVYEGPPVVFGHDARRGLVRVDRDGQPWVIGLDSGCVYGGQLTAWCVKARKFISVDAARAYRSV